MITEGLRHERDTQLTCYKKCRRCEQASRLELGRRYPVGSERVENNFMEAWYGLLPRNQKGLFRKIAKTNFLVRGQGMPSRDRYDEALSRN